MGSGTTFSVYLPALEGETAPVKAAAIELVQGQGRILDVGKKKSLSFLNSGAVYRSIALGEHCVARHMTNCLSLFHIAK